MPQETDGAGSQLAHAPESDTLVGALNRSLAVHGEALPADELVATCTSNNSNEPHRTH